MVSGPSYLRFLAPTGSYPQMARTLWRSASHLANVPCMSAASPDPGVTPITRSIRRPRIRLSGPGALVSCLPRLVGFPPVESVVLIGLVPAPNGRRQVGLTLRVDLDDVTTALDASSEHPCAPRQLAAALARNECTAAQIVVVSERVQAPPGRPGSDELGLHLSTALGAALAAHGLTVSDALVVQRGRWWSYRCRNRACCPPEGTLISTTEADRLGAALVLAGDPAEVLADRSVVLARVAPDTGLRAAAMAAALAPGCRPPADEPVRALTRVARLLEAQRVQDPTVSIPALAQALVDLHQVHVRDACLPAWKGAAGAASLALWSLLTRVAPRGFIAPPATLTALVAYARGDGTLAGVALERALDDDPTYRLALYAAHALSHGLPPQSIRHLVLEAAGDMRSQGLPLLDRSGMFQPGEV